jgi:hypothetical protein
MKRPPAPQGMGTFAALIVCVLTVGARFAPPAGLQDGPAAAEHDAAFWRWMLEGPHPLIPDPDALRPLALELAGDYFFKQTRRYNATDIKRFADHKRYAMMICFLLETRKALLDHLVTMHDQYVMEMCRETRNAHEKKHRDMRKRQKRAIDVVLDMTNLILDWPDEQPLSKRDIWLQVEEAKLRGSLKDLKEFKQLEERGYGDLLLKRYPSLRKYFADFIHLPFTAKAGNEYLMEAVDIIRKLDAGDLKRLPPTAPIQLAHVRDTCKFSA